MARAGPPAATARAAAPSAVSEHCAGHCGESRAPSGDHARRRRRFACRANTGPANHNGTSAQTHFANILLAAFTLRLRTGKNQYYGNHNGSSAQTQCTHILAAAMTMRFAACHNHCFANPTRAGGPSAVSEESRAPSGDHARRRHFCSLWTLRREPGPQRRPRAPEALLQSTTERAGPPAATTRAGGPSAVSEESRAPSKDHARRSLFCSLWTLRTEPGPQRRPRAPEALLQSLNTAERAGPPAATTRAGGPSAVSEESRAPSGDHARRRHFCSLWTLRREPGPQRRPRAPEALLQSLNTAERAGPPAATTRAGGPSAVSEESRAPSGDHARRSPFCSLWTLRTPGPQRRPRAPEALLQSLNTAERAGPPAATTRAGGPSAVSEESRAPSGDHARRRHFCSLWTLRREPGPQRRPRAPEALLQSLNTAERAGPPAATTRAGGPSAVSEESRAPSGDHVRRRHFCSLWTLRREPGPQRRPRPRAPQALLQSLDTAERAGPPAATTRAGGPSAVSEHCGESRAPSGDHARRRPFCSRHCRPFCSLVSSVMD